MKSVTYNVPITQNVIFATMYVSRIPRINCIILPDNILFRNNNNIMVTRYAEMPRAKNVFMIQRFFKDRRK